jgi:hypothetical protein
VFDVAFHSATPKWLAAEQFATKLRDEIYAERHKPQSLIAADGKVTARENNNYGFSAHCRSRKEK